MAVRITQLMEKQARMLFPDDAERQEFLDALVTGQSREMALILLEDKPEIGSFPKYRPEPWQPDFVLRLMDGFGFRPSQHPLYQKGAIYSLDFSSAFAASLMLAIPDRPRRVLDLCASPGGKSIFCWRAFRPAALACNEVIRKRTFTLKENLTRCQVLTSMVSSADPSVWAKKAAEAFDLILVDAPCSGQSLLAKGDEAPGCFHPKMIDVNVGRQRRIIANAVKCLAPGGYLLYMTCTFNYKENEKVIEWILGENEDLKTVERPEYRQFQSRYTQEHCYRLFPQYGLGAGAFASLIRKDGDRPAHLTSDADWPISWRYGEPTRRMIPEES